MSDIISALIQSKGPQSDNGGKGAAARRSGLSRPVIPHCHLAGDLHQGFLRYFGTSSVLPPCCIDLSGLGGEEAGSSRLDTTFRVFFASNKEKPRQKPKNQRLTPFPPNGSIRSLKNLLLWMERRGFHPRSINIQLYGFSCQGQPAQAVVSAREERGGMGEARPARVESLLPLTAQVMQKRLEETG